jgi:hypothetical protein
MRILLVLIVGIGIRGHGRIPEMGLQGLLVYTHGAGSVLWQWDHGGIAPNLRVSGRRAVPMTMTMICSDEVTLVGESELASLDSIAGVSWRTTLHFGVGGLWSCVAASKAAAQVGEPRHDGRFFLLLFLLRR